MSDLALPAEGMRGATICWTTSDASVITDTGAINPPEPGEANLTAKLTATITKGSAKATKEFSVTVVPVDTAYGLTAHYSFDNDLSDSTGLFAAGTITGDKIDTTGGTITYSDGVTGQAAVFDGKSGIRLADGLISNNSYSVSLWLNPSEHTQFTTSFFGANSNKSWISLVPSSWDNNTMLWSGEAWYDGTTGSRISTNEWHHIAFTVDKGAVKVYVDGEQKFSGLGFPNIFNGKTGTFSLGVNWWDAAYKGMMDELRVYNVPITDVVIKKLSQEKPV